MGNTAIESGNRELIVEARWGTLPSELSVEVRWGTLPSGAGGRGRGEREGKGEVDDIKSDNPDRWETMIPSPDCKTQLHHKQATKHCAQWRYEKFSCWLMTTLVSHNFFLPFYLFSEVLWCDIAHGSQHRDSSMLQFCLTTSLEVLDAPVSGKSGGVPKSGRSLHTQLVFEALFVALG